jgi:hypothetical protein
MRFSRRSLEQFEEAAPPLRGESLLKIEQQRTIAHLPYLHVW